MDQLHRRFTVDQVKVMLHGYCQGTLSRTEGQEMLGLGKTRFFALLQACRSNPEAFSIAYERETPCDGRKTCPSSFLGDRAGHATMR